VNAYAHKKIRPPGYLSAWLWVVMLGWATSTAQVYCAEPAPLKEYELKAGVLYHIIKYVEWPGSPATNQPARIQIGLLGQLPQSKALEVLDGKRIEGRELVVKPVSNAYEISSCQVLFIGASEMTHLADIFGRVKNLPILTVGEFEGFAQRGGMINLIVVGNRVVMEVNREVAEQAQLTIRSPLLKHAKMALK